MPLGGLEKGRVKFDKIIYYFKFLKKKKKKLGGGEYFGGYFSSRGDFSGEGTLTQNSCNLPWTYEKLSC